MDPAILGVWNVDLAKTTGLDDFAKVMGFSAEKTEKYKRLDYSIAITQDGDSYKIEVDFKGAAPNASYSLRVGEEIDYKSIDGYTAKLTLSIDGNKSVENYNYAEKGLKWTVTRSVQGNIMTAVTQVGPATLTQYLNRA